MERVHLVNALVFRKDLRGLYFRDKDGWMPVQVPTSLAFDKLLLDLMWDSDWKTIVSICPVVIGSILLFSSPFSRSSPQRKSRIELVHAGMERCSPSTERSAMMETRSSQMPVSVRELSHQEAKFLNWCGDKASLREITKSQMSTNEMHGIMKSDILAIKAS